MIKKISELGDIKDKERDKKNQNKSKDRNKLTTLDFKELLNNEIKKQSGENSTVYLLQNELGQQFQKTLFLAKILDYNK